MAMGNGMLWRGTLWREEQYGNDLHLIDKEMMKKRIRVKAWRTVDQDGHRRPQYYPPKEEKDV